MSASTTSTPAYEVDFGCAPFELLDGIYASRLAKSGLKGDYLEAESEYGEWLCDLVRRGRGAYLHGRPGRGKTYAAAHAVRVFTAERFGRRGRIDTAWLITAKRLLDEIKDDMGTGYAYRIERAEEVGLLIIDDFGAERLTDWAIETLTRIIDTRVAANLPTIFTSNYPLGALRDIWGDIPGSRMASRIGGSCEVREINGQDRRLS